MNDNTKSTFIYNDSIYCSIIEIYLLYNHEFPLFTQAPSKLLVGTFDDVLKFFKFYDYWNEMAITRAIFLWVVHQDIYNLKAAEEPPPNSPLEFFIKMQTSQGGYAHLIWGLCK